MSDEQPIIHYKHADINKAAWDRALDSFTNANVYAQSGFLDLVSPGWDALVVGEYETVMPLCWREKWGIRYLYQPPFTQQLGIFSRQSINPGTCEAFIAEAKKYFRFAEIFLNEQNPVPGTIEKVNYLVDLRKDYSLLRAGYRRDAIKNIRRSEKFILQYTPQDSIGELVSLYQQQYGERTPHIRDIDYTNFANWCTIAMQKDQLVLRKVISPGNQLAAAALLLYFRKRLYLLQSVTTAAGRQQEANYFLIDNIIREFAGGAELLDFEGSDIPGVAHFYKNFGSYNQPYYFLRYNHLPWPIKWMKG